MNHNAKDFKPNDVQGDELSTNLAPWQRSLEIQPKKLINSNTRFAKCSARDGVQYITANDTEESMKPNNGVNVTRLSLNSNFEGLSSADAFSNYQANIGYQSGVNFDEKFSLGDTLSPSSSKNYRVPPTNTHTPPYSTMRAMLDDEPCNIFYKTATIPDTGRESMLMKQALKSTKHSKKRRDNNGEFKTMTRQRPISVPVMPRLSKSSSLMTENYSNAQFARRRHHSLHQPLSHEDRNKLAHFMDEKNQHIYSAQNLETDAQVHWDPHIDAFEILRAKITGITRSMQEFQVRELFQDEERKNKKITATTSSPLITTSNKTGRNDRRFSLTNNNAGIVNTSNTICDHTSSSGHRRIRSQTFINLHNSDNGDDRTSMDNTNDEYNDGFRMKSPNLSALFFTTNNLIHSRLDELSETASIESSVTDSEEKSSRLEWKAKFLGLITTCIHQSEQLESLSTDLLNTEHRVRELMFVNKTVHEQFNEREKQYEERIRECQEVAHQQYMMIESLEELNADIDMKIECSKREAHRQEALRALDAKLYLNGDNQGLLHVSDDSGNSRWNFQKSVSELLSIDDKYDLVQKMRWDVGMFVGGGVGTGHVIHSFEGKLNGIDIMIAGTGTTSAVNNSELPSLSMNSHSEAVDNDENSRKIYSVKPLIRHNVKLHQHQYVLCLNENDRKTRFSILPKHLWIPDKATDRCQFHSLRNRRQCNTHFSFFQRKHHCRKCGHIVCQKHSANRLPLFSCKKNDFIAQWSRVCDNCFQDLIVKT